MITRPRTSAGGDSGLTAVGRAGVVESSNNQVGLFWPCRVTQIVLRLRPQDLRLIYYMWYHMWKRKNQQKKLQKATNGVNP